MTKLERIRRAEAIAKEAHANGDYKTWAKFLALANIIEFGKK